LEKVKNNWFFGIEKHFLQGKEENFSPEGRIRNNNNV